MNKKCLQIELLKQLIPTTIVMFLFIGFQLISFAAFSQSKKIDGTVRDDKGVPLAGVSVSVKGTPSFTGTDESGRYSISVQGNNAILIFSYVSMSPVEVAVGDKTVVDVSMVKLDVNLSDVVIVGYGRQKKQSTVGAQATIKPAELKVPVLDLTNAIGGRIAGVISTQRGGEPGLNGSDLLIRGLSTFQSSPAGPLLVVDGVPDRAFSNLDPEDVESFTILKDATATAVYGTRGANGVILINTKSGKAGTPKVNFEFNSGITKFTFLPKFADAPTFMRLYNEASVTRGRPLEYSEEIIAKHTSGEDPDLYPNVNWYDELFSDYGKNSRVTLNVNGGVERFKYYVSTGYYNETGMLKNIPGTDYNTQFRLKRFSFMSNIEISITKKTKIELGVNGFLLDINRPTNGVQKLFDIATQAPPHVIPIRYSNGQWPRLRGSSRNPYQLLVSDGTANDYNGATRANLKILQDLAFIPGLKAHFLYAFDLNSGNGTTRSRADATFYQQGRDSVGNLKTVQVDQGSNTLHFGKWTYTIRRVYLEGALNYAHSFGDHDISGLLLVNQSVFNDATDRVNSYVAALPYKQRNFVGRATYGYKAKYFAEGNFSYSGSDNFTPKNRYGFFPSFGVGWLVSNESFFKPISKIVSKFKLRYSYGLSGNAGVTDPDKRFLYLTRIVGGAGYNFNPLSGGTYYSGFREFLIGSDVTWETSYKQNLGIELSFLQNDLQLTIELFKERREGILLSNKVVPYYSGFTEGNVPFSNIGKTKNKGIDATLDYNHTFRAKQFITFRGTFTTNQNLAVFDGLPPWRYEYLNKIGKPISQRFGYVATGLFKTQEEIDNAATQSGVSLIGDIRYKDLNGDGKITNDDLTGIGYGDVPRIVYGFTIGGGTHGFDISLFFQGVAKVDFMYAGGYGTVPFSNGKTWGNVYEFATDHWEEGKGDNQTPLYPRLNIPEDINMNYVGSTWWLKRADFLRLKFAEIGYTIPTNALLKKASMERLRVYANGTNLLTWSPWKFWDPELGDGNGARYPNTSVYNIGLRVNFK